MGAVLLHFPILDLPFDRSDLDFQQYENEIFLVAKCDLGLGTFAKRDLAVGDPILTFEGPLIDFLATKRKGSWECMPIQIDRDLYIDTQAPGLFVNHSCLPNAGIREDRRLVAVSEIKMGREIRFDYSTTMLENSFSMECRCLQSNCRRTIADFSTLSRDTQLEYLRAGVVMGFIAREFSHLLVA